MKMAVKELYTPTYGKGRPILLFLGLDNEFLAKIEKFTGETFDR